MDHDREIIELLNSISQEISSKFDALHFEINSMKSTISTLNNKLQENTELLENLYSSTEILNKNLNASLNSPKNCNIKELKEYKDILNSIQEEISNTTNIVLRSKDNSSSRFSSLSEDLMFITHKILQSEKDLFNIQKSLKNRVGGK